MSTNRNVFGNIAIILRKQSYANFKVCWERKSLVTKNHKPLEGKSHLYSPSSSQHLADKAEQILKSMHNQDSLTD